MFAFKNTWLPERSAGLLRRSAAAWIKIALYAGLAYVALFVDIAPCWGACVEWQLTTHCANGTVEYCRTASPDCADCYLIPQCGFSGWTSRSCDCYAWSNPDSLSVGGNISYDACGVEGWCRGGATLTLNAVDGASPPHDVHIFSSPGSSFAFDCGWGTNPCHQDLPEGTGTVLYQAECSGGLVTDPPGSLAWKLDLGAPFLSYSLGGGTAGENGWYRGGPVQMSCAADDSLSGIPSGGLTYGAQTATGDGTHTLSCTAVDRAGNIAEAYAVVSIDGTPPAIEGALGGGTPGAGGWYLAGPVDLTCTATDAVSGVSGVLYGRMTAASDGMTVLDCAADDNAGNSSSYSTSVSIDGVPPTGTFRFAGTYCQGGWYNSPVLVSLEAADGHSGPAGGSFALDGVDWSADRTVGDGVHALSGVVHDVAGNSGSVAAELRVDTLPPATVWNIDPEEWIRGETVLAGTSSDAVSGIAKVELSFDGGLTWVTAGGGADWSFDWDTADPENPVADGEVFLYVRATDKACNPEDPKELTVSVDNTPPDLSMKDTLILMGRTASFQAEDGGSGIASVRVTISGNGIEPRVEEIAAQGGRMEFAWDGHDGRADAAPFGAYEVLLEAWDRAGNRSAVTGTWVRPFPRAPEEPIVPVNDPIDGGGLPAIVTGRDAFGGEAGAAVPRGLPLWSLLLPMGALMAWLAGSNVALARDGRWSELRAIGAALENYRERSNTYCEEEGEDD
ncbi:MAG: Ig-like domain-containing protein [Anaerolineales bacterium]